jgi:hypothetical protein
MSMCAWLHALLARNPLPQHVWGTGMRPDVIERIDLRLRSLMPAGFWCEIFSPKNVGGRYREVRLWAGAWDPDLIAPEDEETRSRLRLSSNPYDR